MIESLFLPAFGGVPPGPQSGGVDTLSASPRPSPPHDSAVLPAHEGRLALTTDSYVVSPLFFPGGDIGKLAVYGTVNDLAMAGARPAYLSAGFVLEEGLPMETLRRVVASMAEAARTAGVRIVTGDTKVVDRGKGDGMFINTAGIGLVAAGHRDFARPSCTRRRHPAQRRPRPARHRHYVGPRRAPASRAAGKRLRPAGRAGRGDAGRRAPTSTASAT